MSVTPELRASARATYRLLFRAAANTFRGDDRVLNAFREKVRADFREGRSITEAEEFSTRIQVGREAAEVLRKNVVQGVRVDGPRGTSSVANAKEKQGGSVTAQNEGGIWRLRLTKDTELGSNETVKGPSPRQSSGVKQTCCQSSFSADVSSKSGSNSRSKERFIAAGEEQPEDALDEEISENPEDANENPSDDSNLRTIPPRKLNYSTLKRLSENRVKPVLNEDDLEEKFVRGSGPGGQSINKTANNVQLLHKPTGIRVTCQETRSLQTNRMIARRNLLEKLDRLANPGLSKEEMRRAKEVERERRRRSKARRKARNYAKAIKQAVETEDSDQII